MDNSRIFCGVQPAGIDVCGDAQWRSAACLAGPGQLPPNQLFRHILEIDLAWTLRRPYSN